MKSTTKSKNNIIGNKTWINSKRSSSSLNLDKIKLEEDTPLKKLENEIVSNKLSQESIETSDKEMNNEQKSKLRGN